MAPVRPLVAVIGLITLLASPVATQPAPARRVAVTFDDLPGAPAAAVSNRVADLTAQTTRLLAQLGRGLYPNGLALSADERRLFVANFAGITVVDLATRTQAPLAHGAGVALTGADGLYLYRNSLVAVQNAHRAPDRVVRLFLNAAGDRVEAARVLESNHPLYDLPTTGVVVGDEFFYMANTHIQSLGPDGKLSPAAKLRDVLVLKLKLK